MPYSILPTDRLLVPSDIYPNVATVEQYLAAQRASILQKMAQFPRLRWRLPFLYQGEPVPIKVSDAHVQLVCPCGNYPAYDPVWQCAACFTCGAIYRQPPPVDWPEITRVLLQRPKLSTRHMLPGQTLEELRAENRQHGDPD